MANISIVEGEIPILEEATSPKMFGHLGNALVKAADNSQVVLDLPNDDKARVCGNPNLK